jgi:indole-3-glycerol phosphate synthase
MNITLAEIVAHKREEIAQQKGVVASDSLFKNISIGHHGFRRALSTPGLHLIAEIKPMSPSAGILREDLQLDAIVKSYDDHATAISVLTDERFFGGSFELLAHVKSISSLPVLCKDFILDRYQCLRARSVGADAVLLVVKILDDGSLADLYSQIVDLGMTPVVEIQNETELERAMMLQPDVIVINNRNLDTFQIDLSTTIRLAPKLPRQTIVIAASGVKSRTDIEKLLPFCSKFLVGTVLMEASSIDDKLKELNGKACLPSGDDFAGSEYQDSKA